MAEKNRSLYLYKKGEERPRLFHGDDVEAAKADGWEEPDFPKSTGTEWNAEEDYPQQDVAADLLKTKQQYEEKKAKADEPAKASKAK